MPRKKEFLKVIDQPTPVTGGGALTAQTSSIAPPVVGTIPPPTNLTVTSMIIARSAQAPFVYINLSWTPSRNTTPEYYVVEYSKSPSFTNPERAKAMGPSAAIMAATSTVYYIRVQAAYRTSISDWSNTVTPTTPADTTAPTDVSSVGAVFINGNIVINWTEPSPTNETYKDARIRIWNPGRTILYATYHLRGGTFIWTEEENMRLISGGVTSVSIDVTSRGWNNVYGTPQITSATLSAPTAPTSLVSDFTTGDLLISWTNPTGIPYRDIEVKLYESSSKVTNYKTYYLNGNSVVFSKEDNYTATSNNPDTSIYVEIKTRGWLGLMSTALSGTITHTAPSPVSNLIAEFIAGDFIVKWDNPANVFKDIEVKIYESSSKVTNYKTYYILGNTIIFSQADNYNVNGSSPDTSMFVEVKTRSWLGLLSGSSSYTATLQAPNPVTSVTTDFTTGDLEIRWTNPTNTSYRDVEVKLYESSSKVTNYKTYYTHTNRVIFTKEDNFVAVDAAGGTGADTSIYYEITVRSWLGIVSSIVTGTATHTAPSPVTSVVSNFATGDLEISWTNLATSFKDVEIKLYESSSKVTNYKTYYIQGNRIKFTVEDNFNATAGVGDTSIYYEIKVRSWLDALSTAVTGTVTHAAPDPVSSVTTDFTTGDLLISWTNPLTPFKDVEVKLYESSSKVTNYKTYYLNGSSIRFSAEDNLTQTANAGDRSIYYEIKARSWLGLFSSTASATVTKALPAAPSNVIQTWTGDDGTFAPAVTLTWDIVPHAKAYTITIDSVAVYTVATNIFEYTYQQNVADHIGSGDFGDPTLNIAINTIDRINQSSTGASNNVVTNAAPPAGSVITITAVGGFSTIGAFIDLTKPIKDLMHYVYELHDGVSVVETITTSSQIVTFEGIVSGTYTVKVHAVDLFNRSGSTITSSSTTIDSITIDELRAEAKYTDDQSRTSPTLDTLKDDDISTTINYTHTAAGAYHWTKITRPLLDRYGIVSFYSPDDTEVYFGLSTDDSTYTWYSGPVDSNGIVTEVASEAAAKTARISISGGTAKRFQLPAIQEARFVKVGHRSNNVGAYLVSELYPRRLVQSDDIQAESILAINIAAGAITADKISVTSLSAVSANMGTVVINTGGYIRSGQTAYDTGTGFYLGNDSGTPKFSLGSSTTSVTWDGTNLRIQGGGLIIRTASSNQRVQLTSAGLAGFDSSNVLQVNIDTADGKLKAAAGAVVLDSTGIIITTGGNARSGQTAYDTGTGWWIGNDGGTVKASFGNASGDKLTWNGSVLAVTGQFNLSGVATIGTSGGLYQGSGTFASPTTGLKLYNSGGIGKLSTYNSSVEQIVIDTDGKLKAGAGTVILDAKGVSLQLSTTLLESATFKFIDTTYNAARVYSFAYDTGSIIHSGFGSFPDTADGFIPSYSYTALSRSSTVYIWSMANGNSKLGRVELVAKGTNSSGTGTTITFALSSDPNSTVKGAFLSGAGLGVGYTTGDIASGQIKATAGIFAGSTDAGGTGASSGADIRPSGSTGMSVGSTDAYNTPPKARIWGVTKYTAAGAYTTGPYIEFGKDNATDGNFAYYMAFAVRANGSSTAEAMRIVPTGTLLIGRTSGLTGAGELDVNGRCRADTFETDGEGSQWKLKGFTGAGSAASVGYVEVIIDGTTRKLMVQA